MDGGNYRSIGTQELAALCARIEAEARKLTVTDLGGGRTGVRATDSWLLDGNPDAILRR